MRAVALLALTVACGASRPPSLNELGDRSTRGPQLTDATGGGGAGGEGGGGGTLVAGGGSGSGGGSTSTGGGASVDCAPPGAAVVSPACAPALDEAYLCDPFSAVPCATGEACAFTGQRFECLTALVDLRATCQRCAPEEGKRCAAGATCDEVDGVCRALCCDDDQCAPDELCVAQAGTELGVCHASSSGLFASIGAPPEPPEPSQFEVDCDSTPGTGDVSCAVTGADGACNFVAGTGCDTGFDCRRGTEGFGECLESTGSAASCEPCQTSLDCAPGYLCSDRGQCAVLCCGHASCASGLCEPIEPEVGPMGLCRAIPRPPEGGAGGGGGAATGGGELGGGGQGGGGALGTGGS